MIQGIYKLLEDPVWVLEFSLVHISFTIKSSCCLHLTWSNRWGVIDGMDQKQLRAHTKQGSENTLGMAEGFWSLEACSSNTLPNPFLTVPPTAGGAVFTQTTLLHNRRQVSDWLYLEFPQRCPGVGTVLNTLSGGLGTKYEVEGGEGKRFKGKVLSGAILQYAVGVWRSGPATLSRWTKQGFYFFSPQRFMFGVFVGFGAKLSDL